jgi:glyoxylase-like metal-dependent hydrolase (beta-lactamase superfamily II)
VDDVLFTGDTLFAGSCGRTDLRGGSYEEIIKSLRRLGQLEGNFHVCPGHDGTSTLDRERKTNPYLIEAMRG